MLPQDAQGVLLSRTTSGRITGDYSHSVSYLSIAFSEAAADTADIPEDQQPPQAPSGPDGLSPEDLELLHALAGATIEAVVRADNRAPLAHVSELLAQLPPRLTAPAGAFVTLRRQGRLRGCMGYYLPEVPLYRAVVHNAVSAALRDPRFRPLREEELADLDIEVSVLTPPHPIGSPEEFRAGEDGIILEKAGRDAVFLPEVARHMGWDRERTLSRLALKAGLDGNAWKDGARLQVFRSRKYSAPFEPGHGRP
jgi:AmmeMemoRadiSam system protein A